MADEKAIASSDVSPVASTALESVAAADSHKRKLDDLELNNAPEPPAESDPNSTADAVNNGSQEEENGLADESETKRPRLESNGENVSEADCPENGHQVEENEDGPKEEEYEQPESESADRPESADANIEEEEKKDESKEVVAERPKSVDANVEPLEDQEHIKEPLEAVTPEPVSNEEKTEIGSSDELGQQKAETEEPSDLPREGDVPVHSESQPGLGRQILSRKMVVPNDKVGVLIGKAGDTIRTLQDNSGAKIQIMRDADADPRSTTRPLELVGTLEDINLAEKLIKGVIAEADAGGSPSLIARGFNAGLAASGGEQVEIQVPIEKVGVIIGKGGETIRNLQTRSGARIQLIQPNLSDGEQSKERIVRITGSKKQIETAREMIKDVMNQTVRQSSLSSGYSQQQGYRPRGPVAPQWGSRGGHHRAQFSGYDYSQRGPPSYPSQNSQYPPLPYGNYPPAIAPRSNYGPSWDQRPPMSMHGPSSQGNYHYGQHPGPEYGQHPHSYSQTQPPQPYSHGPHGYNEAKYDNHAPPQHYGPQPTPYAQGGTNMHSGYGPPQDQYGKPPPMYNMQQPQVPPPHAQPYGQQPRPNQPAEAPYQGPAISYGQNMPPPQQQPYPYAPSGPVQQTYPNPPPYGSAPASDGYGQTYPNNPSAAAPSSAPSGYGQPVAGYGPQAGAQPQPQAYPQVGPTGGYGSYPAPQPAAYAEQQQPVAAAYGYQAPSDPAAAYGGAVPQQGPPAAAVGPGGYAAQPSQSHQPGYDQSGGGYIAAPVVGYGKSGSPQAGYPPQQQYDASQMYGAQQQQQHR